MHKFKIKNKGKNIENSEFRSNTKNLTYDLFKNKLCEVSKLVRNKRQRTVADNRGLFCSQWKQVELFKECEWSLLKWKVGYNVIKAFWNTHKNFPYCKLKCHALTDINNVSSSRNSGQQPGYESQMVSKLDRHCSCIKWWRLIREGQMGLFW